MSPDEAMAELKQYEAKIKGEGLNSFPKYAAERSDCSSFRNQGDLGEFGRGMMYVLFCFDLLLVVVRQNLFGLNQT